MRSRVPLEHEVHSDSQKQREAIGLTHLFNNLFDLYFLNSLEIPSRFLAQNVFRHDLTHLPCYHESHSGIKSTRIPKYNAKRSESHWSIKCTRIPKYNAKQLESHLRIKSTRIPKYNAKRKI
ncbi:uncharacterized protein G2W53_007611 [Senna tora]|uniref:Uncharacterized protein n=1 Tax=Senna tora TaxID=362788 RepID=A0A835CEE4_9FABA|nr:uncharacterized protein G2W53_007611 [Senna tora]